MQRLRDIFGTAGVKELPLERVSATDKVVIRTVNSTYVFWLIDPDARRGLLSGGLVGHRLCNAVLVGTVTDAARNIPADPTVLRTNSRALFFIKAKNGLERLITSVITKLVHIKGHLSESSGLRWSPETGKTAEPRWRLGDSGHQAGRPHDRSQSHRELGSCL